MNPRQSRIPGARRLAVAALGAALGAVALAGCGGGNDDATATEGTVSSVEDAGDPFVFVLSAAPQNGLNNAIITVDARDIEGAEPSEIERGDKVKVWADACTHSIPAQCQATALEVLDR